MKKQLQTFRKIRKIFQGQNRPKSRKPKSRGFTVFRDEYSIKKNSPQEFSGGHFSLKELPDHAFKTSWQMRAFNLH